VTCYIPACTGFAKLAWRKVQRQGPRKLRGRHLPTNLALFACYDHWPKVVS